MQNQVAVDFTQYRKQKEKIVNKKVQHSRGKGSVYARNGKLWIDFRYLGQRVREPSGLLENAKNKKLLRKQLDLIIAEIANGVFDFAIRFPSSKKKEHFAKIEGKQTSKEPENVYFGDYVQEWLNAMQKGMSSSQLEDYQGALNAHILPYFSKMNFSELNVVRMKKFVALMKGKSNGRGGKLSAKRIKNVMIPLRVIVRDCIDEHGWTGIPDPFFRCKLPRSRKFRVQPFNFQEWNTLLEQIPDWYKPYFELAVQTGLRPSEQVALKWSAIDTEYMNIELSRVRNVEKEDLKTHESRRRIYLRPTIRKTLEKQRNLTKGIDSPYVFVNMQGQPVFQETLRELWKRIYKKLDITYRRMYETRHTFASWALASGETPEWIARTLGHVDTTMVYRTYGCYIPNLKTQDGSALERQFMVLEKENGN